MDVRVSIVKVWVEPLLMAVLKGAIRHKVHRNHRVLAPLHQPQATLLVKNLGRTLVIRSELLEVNPANRQQVCCIHIGHLDRFYPTSSLSHS